MNPNKGHFINLSRKVIGFRNRDSNHIQYLLYFLKLFFFPLFLKDFLELPPETIIIFFIILFTCVHFYTSVHNYLQDSLNIYNLSKKLVITMITADFMPKDDKKVCENCIHYEKCPVEYVCPTLDRIYTRELLEKIMEEQEE